MRTLFAASVCLVLYTYAVYPLIVAALGRWRPRRLRQDDAYLPPVTLIVSAYNEETIIEQKLRNSLALDYPRERLEIVVASESTDGTNAIVSRHRGERVVLRAFPGRLGKSATLFHTVPAARGEIVVFSDANSVYRPDTLRKLVRHFADPRVGCVVGHLVYREAIHSIGARGETIYWRYNHWLRRYATRTSGLVPGVTGGVFAIRKRLYFPFGEARGDDFELSTRIAIRGYAVVFEPEAIAEEQASETTRQQFRRKMRLVRWNLVSALLLLREAIQFRSALVAFQVFSHQLLRYSVSVWLVLAGASSLALAGESLAFRVVVAIQAAFYTVGLIGCLIDAARLPFPRFWLIPSYFVMVNSAAIAAIIAGLSRGQVNTWKKQR